jgi:gamma-glutamyltranspeptidase/glutathione hydrolase
MTTSLGAAFGCRVLVPECGFLLSSHVADFAPAPGRPNAYGVRYGPPNVIAPGKASVSSATPMLAFRDGKLRLALGGSGSGRIVPAVTQVLVDVLDFGLTPGEAVALPRFQVSGQSNTVWLEKGFPARARFGLPLLGLPVNVGVKRASVTAIEARPGRMLGGSDPRKFGLPLGY